MLFKRIRLYTSQCKSLPPQLGIRFIRFASKLYKNIYNSPKKGNPQVIPTLARGVGEGVEVYIARCIDCFTFKI